MAQQAPDSTTNDSMRTIEIIQARSWRQITTDSGKVLQALAGNAMIRQENTILSGDSIVFDPETGIAEVFGNVHINDGDSVQTFSQYLRYVGNERKAYLKKDVRFIDKKGTLMANEVVYDIGTGMATYQGGGRVVNGSTTLTSSEAVYYSNSNDIYFKRKVHLIDPKYNILADSLLYNTQTQTSTFIAPTRITTKDGSIINTSNGVYNLQSGEATFLDRTTYSDSTHSIVGNKIEYEEKTNTINIEGNGKLVDSVNKVIIIGNSILLNRKNQTFLASKKPVMIFYEGKDSTYIAADTIYSGMVKNDDSLKITLAKKDTLSKTKTIGKKEADSIRYFTAFHHVRIFNDSLQAASDSLYYSTNDSTLGLYKNPVFWSNNSQISGDTIYLTTENKNPKQLEVINNSMVINRTTEGLFNQVSGRTLTGYFKNGNIDYARMKGIPAESIFYAQDEDSAYVGMNRSSGDVIDVYFSNRNLNKVKFINNVDGVLYPMNQIPQDKKVLPGFNWQDSRRPKNKFELFE